MTVAFHADMRLSKACQRLASLLIMALNPACHCDCEPATMIALATLDVRVAQSVLVKFSPGDGTEPQIVCAWADSDTGGAATWTCTPAAADVVVHTDSRLFSEFTYAEADVSSVWSIELQGPSGSSVLTRAPRGTDPGEGYPGTCVCYPYTVSVAPDELRAVGATVP